VRYTRLPEDEQRRGKPGGTQERVYPTRCPSCGTPFVECGAPQDGIRDVGIQMLRAALIVAQAPSGTATAPQVATVLGMSAHNAQHVLRRAADAGLVTYTIVTRKQREGGRVFVYRTSPLLSAYALPEHHTES
jgi:hypothetical protein